MSLFAKLSSANKPAPVVNRQVPESTSQRWTAQLVRSDEISQPTITGICPLNSTQVRIGSTCRIRWSEAGSALISLTQESVKPGTAAGVLAIPVKTWEALGIPKDVKEVKIEDVSTDTDEMVSNTLEELVIAVKDRYVSKRDLWVFQIRLLGSVVYRGTKPAFDELLKCPQTTVADIVGGRSPSYGIVGPQTKIVVRSHSAQLVIVVSITRELWNFDPYTSQPVFRKTIQFLTEGLSAAISEGRHHFLTLLVTMRPGHIEGAVIPDMYENVYEGPIQLLSVEKLRDQFLDFFNNFPAKSGWNHPVFGNKPALTEPTWFSSTWTNGSLDVTYIRDTAVCACKHARAPNTPSSPVIPSSAYDANILESINLCISHFSKHHLDRKLHVTGTHITVITANSGALGVSSSALRDISKRRIETSACGIRLVSVSAPPPLSTGTTIITDEKVRADWLPFLHFRSSSPSATADELASQIDRFALSVLESRTGPTVGFNIGSTMVKPPGMQSSLDPRPAVVRPFTDVLKKPRRPDPEIVNAAIVTPRLQRVAVEATVRPSDIKPIDNWIVQGEGTKTLHDLIGVRLSLDMQFVDNSGGSDITIPTSTPATPSMNGDVSTPMISAEAFGVRIQRSSMREAHITKGLLKGDQCLWMLNKMDTGNIYVSRVSLSSDSAAAALGVACASTPQPEPMDYTYELRFRDRSALMKQNSASKKVVVSDIIACKQCIPISATVSLETRRFTLPSPLPWNLLDELISNPYIQQTLPSTVPYTSAPVPPDLEGFRWKLRSSIRTGLFCLVPEDEGFGHICIPPNQISSLGSTDVLATSAAVAGISSAITSRFLDWLRKVEKLLQVTLPVQVVGEGKQRKPNGLTPHFVKTSTEWFQLQIEEQFLIPRLVFVFSIEWVLCHSATIDRVIDSLSSLAGEDKFKLLQLPHAQLFPPPFPGALERDLSFDLLPFRNQVELAFPSRVSGSFYALLLSRLLETLQLILLISTKDETCPEGIFAGRRKIYSREPGWVLMSRDASFLVQIRATSALWIRNYTGAWSSSPSGSCEEMFFLFKQVIHTSIIDSSA